RYRRTGARHLPTSQRSSGKRALSTAAGLLGSKWPTLQIFWPHLGSCSAKQAAFLSLDCLEAGYGGAAGGGKSDAILAGALQYVDVPGYAALILRRTYAQLTLPDSIMDRAHQWLGGT